MGLHRRILTSDRVNGSDCFYECPGACYDGRCVASPPPSSSDDSAGIQAGHSSRHLSNLFIAAGCLIAAAFFLALTYYGVFSHRRQRRRPPFAAASPGPGSDGFVEGEGDHHLWHIRTVGLDEATIGSIAVYEYKAGEGLLGAATTDCSVCLGEFRDGELVRLLPKCDHAFHVPCIDTWLRAHVNCPICRARIVAPPVGTADPTAVGHSVEGDLGSLDNSPTSVQALGSDQGVSEGEGEDDGMDSRTGVAIDPPASSSHPPSRVPSDLGEGGSEPVRRSISMILLPHGASLPRAELEESFCEEGKEPSAVGEHSSKNIGKQGNSSKEVEKSLLGSGRGFFFSKYGRSRSLVLPL